MSPKDLWIECQVAWAERHGYTDGVDFDNFTEFMLGPYRAYRKGRAMREGAIYHVSVDDEYISIIGHMDRMGGSTNVSWLKEPSKAALMKLRLNI